MPMETLSTSSAANPASCGSDACAEEKALAVGQLYETFRRRIHAHTYRLLGNQQDADDVTQEVFITAYLSWESLYDRAHLAAWLYQVATNLCVDLLRGRKRRSSQINRYTESVTEADAAYRPSTGGGIPEIAEREHIQRTFAHLPRGYSLPLLLSAAAGVPYWEIAAIIGVSPNAAATRLTRAKKLFAEEYQRLGSEGAVTREEWL
jgi:RNA polymerase sigma-70 factor (ECF subfamily)